MPVSLASRHKQAVIRHDLRKVRQDLPPASGTPYKTHLVKLEVERARLSRIRSISKRDEIKKSLIPDYMGYVQSVISADKGLQDEVFVTLLVWCIDVGEYGKALLMAEYAIGHGLKPPKGFNRTLAEVVTEELAEAALKASNPASFMDRLQAVAEMTGKLDLLDEIRAKLHKAIGLACMVSSKDEALSHLRQAKAFNPRISVKRLVNKLEKELEINSDGH